MPGLVKLRKEHPEIEVIGWHVGAGTSAEIEKVVKKQKVDYPVVASPSFEEVGAWGNRGIPSVVLIDKKGKVRYRGLKPAAGEEKALELSKE
jgi:hypothetical protein